MRSIIPVEEGVSLRSLESGAPASRSTPSGGRPGPLPAPGKRRKVALSVCILLTLSRPASVGAGSQ
eukprot:7838649-Pyramimonas_sp.AAC.1